MNLLTNSQRPATVASVTGVTNHVQMLRRRISPDIVWRAQIHSVHWDGSLLFENVRDIISAKIVLRTFLNVSFEMRRLQCHPERDDINLKYENSGLGPHLRCSWVSNERQRVVAAA